MARLLQRLKARKLFQWALAYLAGGRCVADFRLATTGIVQAFAQRHQ